MPGGVPAMRQGRVDLDRPAVRRRQCRLWVLGGGRRMLDKSLLHALEMQTILQRLLVNFSLRVHLDIPYLRIVRYGPVLISFSFAFT
jgi:hypothetical protein